ncbi:hypothetical protein Hdeb2414_s0003g00086641 [Helianthus debilis subsp. tardiflorus]
MQDAESWNIGLVMTKQLCPRMIYVMTMVNIFFFLLFFSIPLMIFVQGLLSFYGLPLSQSAVEVTTGPTPQVANGAKYELNTLPVRISKSNLQFLIPFLHIFL